jgi:hypothetical protein
MRTLRIICLCASTAAAVMAQATPAASVAALENTAQQRTAEWLTLAQGLSGTIGRLLPCDPKVTAAIAAVSAASDARLSALNAFLQAAVPQLAQDSEAAKRAAAAEQSLASDLAVEKSETALEQTALDGQVANLVESARTQTGLSGAQTDLQQIQAQVQKRSDSIQTAFVDQDLLGISLRGVVSAADARSVAWKDLQTAYAAEGARWKAYYAARIARAETECSITKGVANRPPAPATKGKKQ